MVAALGHGWLLLFPIGLYSTMKVLEGKDQRHALLRCDMQPKASDDPCDFLEKLFKAPVMMCYATSTMKLLPKKFVKAHLVMLCEMQPR